MKRIEVYLDIEATERIKDVLSKLQVRGVTLSSAINYHNPFPWHEHYRGTDLSVNYKPMMCMVMIVSDDQVTKITDAIAAQCFAGEVGNGTLFIYPVENAIKIRPGKEGETAL